MILFRYVLMITFPSMVIIYLGLSSVHKMAGVEFIQVYLVMTYLFLLHSDILPLRSFLQLAGYVDLPILSAFVDYNNPEIDHKALESAFPAIIYYIIVVLVAISYIIVRIFKKLTESQSKSLDCMFFNKILFPFTLAFFFEIRSAINIFFELNL